MILELKETRPHGTKEYPYDQCFIHNVRHNFQFPVHWHDEFEIIYIIKGSLKISIEDRDYTGTAGTVFLVNPKELHLMGSADLSVAYYTLLFPLEFISFQSKDELEQTLLQPLRSGQLLLANEITDAVLLNKLETCFLTAENTDFTSYFFKPNDGAGAFYCTEDIEPHRQAKRAAYLYSGTLHGRYYAADTCK